MSTLYTILQSLFGTYTPVVTDYTYQSSSGYINHSITVSPDWGYIACVIVFGLVLISIFKFIGGIFSK